MEVARGGGGRRGARRRPSATAELPLLRRGFGLLFSPVGLREALFLRQNPRGKKKNSSRAAVDVITGGGEVGSVGKSGGGRGWLPPADLPRLPGKCERRRSGIGPMGSRAGTLSERQAISECR